MWQRRLTRRVRERLDFHRQNGLYRGLRFAPFRGRVSSRQPPVTRAVMVQVRSLHQHNEDERSHRIEKWQAHLAKLEKWLQQKVDFLKNKYGHRETAVTQAQTELQTLIEQHWQEAKHE